MHYILLLPMANKNLLFELPPLEDDPDYYCLWQIKTEAFNFRLSSMAILLLPMANKNLLHAGYGRSNQGYYYCLWQIKTFRTISRLHCPCRIITAYGK